MLKDIKLTTRIVASIAFAIIGMLIISGSTYLGLTKIGAELEEIAEYQIPINTHITELEKDILQEEILTYELFIASKDIHSKTYKDVKLKIKKLEKSTDKTLKKSKKLVSEAIAHNNDEKTKSTYNLFWLN